MSDLEENIKAFRDLQEKAVELHPYTWCVKTQKAVPTGHLIARECVTCPEDVMNGGICDPL